MSIQNEKKCCFTGHRPNGFPWNGNQQDSRQKALLGALRQEIEAAIKDGYTYFICGNALGVDSWAAEIVIELKESNPIIKLELAIPFEHHNQNVQEPDRQLLARIHSKADVKSIISTKKSIAESFVIRNHYMVDHSSRLIAVYDERSENHGGTEETLLYAKQKGLCIHQIQWMDL